MELPSTNEFYVTTGYFVNGIHYYQEAFVIEVNMVQSTTALMTITPYQAECMESAKDAAGICPKANEPGAMFDSDIFPDNDNGIEDGCDVGGDENSAWSEVNASGNCPDRRIGNIVNLKIEYDI